MRKQDSGPRTIAVSQGQVNSEDSWEHIDRDALLALANEIEANDVTYYVSTQYVLDDWARRIREALGMERDR